MDTEALSMAEYYYFFICSSYSCGVSGRFRIIGTGCWICHMIHGRKISDEPEIIQESGWYWYIGIHIVVTMFWRRYFLLLFFLCSHLLLGERHLCLLWHNQFNIIITIKRRGYFIFCYECICSFSIIGLVPLAIFLFPISCLHTLYLYSSFAVSAKSFISQLRSGLLFRLTPEDENPSE